VNRISVANHAILLIALYALPVGAANGATVDVRAFGTTGDGIASP
jgi:hypothetical protein